VEEPDAVVAAPKAAAPKRGQGLALVRYRSLFSGPAVERVQQLQFQRPADEVELSYEDASARGIAAGSTVTVSSNGTSRSLRARVSRRLRKGVVRIPSEHAEGLHDRVEVKAG
jgi:predicted molibdopterin-dependent oxidoreductase YjgC